jgi:type II secretory pathway component PulK
VALEWTVAAKSQRLSVAGIVDRAQLEAFATGGVEHARAQLSELLRVGPMQSLRDANRVLDAWGAADGSVLNSDVGGELRYRVELHDVGTRLNLNAASEDQLRTLFVALRVDARRADRLAQAIADWRDADQIRRANGAEQADYLREGRAMLPDDGPFASVAMLRFVIGMNDSVYQLVHPYLTVFGSGRVDVNAAERPVLLALPGMTEESVALVMQYRRQRRRVTDLDRLADELSANARQRLRDAIPVLQVAAVLEPRDIHVASDCWRVGSNIRVRVDAIVSRDEEGRVVWRRVSP